MPTVVNVDDETKSKLEALQSEIESRTGKLVTQRKILSELLDTVVDSRSKFIDSFREGRQELSEAEIGRLNEGRIESGVETKEEDIDDILYR